MSRDLSFLEFKDSDDDDLRAMKAEMQMVMAMTDDESRLYFQEQQVESDEHYLRWMISQNNYDDEVIAIAIGYARKYAESIELYGETDEWVTAAEDWLAIARDTKRGKFTIKDIRKQREKIWREKRKLSQMRKAIEPRQS